MIIQWYSAALNMWYRSRFIDMEKCSHRIAKSRLHYSMYYLVTFLFLNMCVGDDRISTVLISGWYSYFSLFSSRVSRVCVLLLYSNDWIKFIKNRKRKLFDIWFLGQEFQVYYLNKFVPG